MSKARSKKFVSRSKTSNKPGLKASGALVIVSAPSGGGKTTIVDRLLKRHPGWVRSISMTTRPPRMGERDGADYFFVSPERFAAAQKKGDLLESAKIFKHAYGTPKQFVLDHLKRGAHVILAIDVQGAKSVRKVLGSAVPLLSFFILPPSVKVLRERLEGRNTESKREVEERMAVAQEEIKAASFYDCTVVNRKLEETVLEIEDGIAKFQKKKEKKNHALHSA